MLNSILIEHGAPTLAGIKTGNIFTVKNTSANITNEIRQLNGVLTKKGLRLIPVRSTVKNTLVYLYRPDRLHKDLENPVAEEILERKGYPCGDTNCCISHLVRRLMSDEDFPHEIGLFLGYPPSDVKSFMEHPCEGVKCSGCWKAYSNECEAEKMFELYKRCSKIYVEEMKKGKPLESLVVDTSGLKEAV